MWTRKRWRKSWKPWAKAKAMKTRNRNRKRLERDMKTCVLCNKQFSEWGNNPAPLAEKGQCCDSCDCRKVIPARLLRMSKMTAVEAAAIGEQLYAERLAREAFWKQMK